eukprot:CAMPEP_0206056518 /NCGR_PEP_ID=MMETSP1466-20131121/42400_1 /ASSEMBLY_ACC=CAM_ASM_001126 /TAXON_ID=44452 /ORGANISM="Pavlova gyrans, Strain CCMP608" /LENGTH=71 /DNA_ID=CAMNT_0053431755 /DNA_START=32 /DNA_END=247 /DNA_ORIENTATION=-
MTGTGTCASKGRIHEPWKPMYGAAKFGSLRTNICPDDETSSPLTTFESDDTVVPVKSTMISAPKRKGEASM